MKPVPEIMVEAVRSRIAEELYVLRPAYRATPDGDKYVTTLEAASGCVPEWNEANSAAEQFVSAWLKPAESVEMFAYSKRLHSLRSIEEQVVLNAVRHRNGSVTKAALSLGIGRSTLYRMLREMGVAPSELKRGEVPSR